MKFPRLLLICCTWFLSGQVWAETSPREGAILTVKGTVTLASPGGAGSAAAKVGDKIQAGSRLMSGPLSQATVRFFDGTITVVQADSDVSVETLSAGTEAGKTTSEITTLNLKKGGIVASLDPAKKNVTNYRVKTPKGVAEAHGTVFSVRIAQNQTDANVTTMSGTVTFITDRGEVTVAFGQSSSGNGVMTVAQAVAANPELAQAFVEAATSVAAAVGSGAVTNTAGAPNNVNTVLAALVDVATQAAPNQAAAIARDVFAAAVPGLGANAATAAQVITQAAIAGVAKADPALSTSVANQVADAVVGAGNAASISLDRSILLRTPPLGVVAGGDPAANVILPVLDQTQVVVSPSK